MADLYAVVVNECVRAGGPTDRCLRIYQTPHTSRGGLSRRQYWEAVQEGTNRHRWRNKKVANVR